MPVPALILLALLSSPETATEKSPPVVVTGRPWAPFISPMGEPFRARRTSDDTLAAWFAKADRNRDGILTVDEMQADAERFFTTLDTDHDGEIGPDELVRYEWEVAPEIQVNSRTRRQPGEKAEASSRRGGWRPGEGDEGDLDFVRASEGRKTVGLQGAARYALLNIPEPVAAADADFNRGISLAEFRQAAADRFQLLDTAHQGRIGFAQLQAVRASLQIAGRQKQKEDSADPRVGNPLPPGK
jgi:Ca2+-binding EF-hand superfamily protein